MGDSRIVPVHPELARLLRDHIAEFGTSPDGRLFSGVRGGELATVTYRRAWIRGRMSCPRPSKLRRSRGGLMTCGTLACPPG